MSVFQIKILAIILMVLDHIALFFFPQFFILRLIGRCSYPLFAWLIANGAYYSHNRQRYLFRLLLVGFITQVPYTLANRLIYPPFWSLNIFFTLSLGLIGIMLVDKTKDKFLRFLIILGCCVVAVLLKVEYQAGGVLSIIAFYFYYNDFEKIIFTQLLIYGSFFTIPEVLKMITHLHTRTTINIYDLLEPIGLFSLFIIVRYNHQEGRKAKLLFYSFYPIQFILFYFLLKFMIGSAS